MKTDITAIGVLCIWVLSYYKHDWITFGIITAIVLLIKFTEHPEGLR